MKMNKKIGISGILVLAALIAFPMMSMSQDAGTGKNTARTMKMERGKGQWGGRAGNNANLTTEQQDQIEKLHKKFRDDNADTIKQLMTKHFDLNTILDSDKPDGDKARAIQKEISDLNAKLAQKRIDLYIETRKINPDAKLGAGEGRGNGMMGRMGMGDEN
jgi:Spy/CpxP family protein refolding chaperone